jgi:cytochrome c oxidase assembly factor CtaG
VITAHWTLDPLVVVCAVVAVVHARGLARWRRAVLAAGRDWRRWRYQALIFYAGMLLLVVALASPLEYWSQTYLWIHMLQHIILGLGAPPLIVIGAPWVPLLRGLPGPLERGVGRLLGWGRRPGGGVAAWRRVAASPLLWVAAFNLDMVFWHLPGPFDLSVRNTAIRIFVEHVSFVGFGLGFWLQICGSYPFRPALHPRLRVGAELVTNIVMWLVAMSLVLFSHDVYSVYSHVHGKLLSQGADQQIAGGILWVCGEFSLIPSGYVNVVAWLREEVAAHDIVVQGLASRRRWSGPAWADRPSPPSPPSGTGPKGRDRVKR